MFSTLLNQVRERVPIVHHITNYVTVNDCANATLAVGGSPIMADDLGEVCDMVALSSALVINMGTLNERTVASMLAAGKHANRLGRPVVFDPVGAGASALRNETLAKLLREVHFTVIRGNISEIRAVAAGSGTTRGVDADARDAIQNETLDDAIAFARALAQRLDCVIAISGAIDLVCSADRAYIIRNGHPIMARITGSGCMSTSVVGAFVGASPENALDAAAAAVCAMGVAGELAAQDCPGTGTFRTRLLDALSTLDEAALLGGMSCEAR